MIRWATGTLLGLCVAVAAMLALVGSTFPRANSSAEGISPAAQDRGEGKTQPAMPVEADKGYFAHLQIRFADRNLHSTPTSGARTALMLRAAAARYMRYQNRGCATSGRYKQALACPYTVSISKPKNRMEDAVTRQSIYHTLSPADRITVAKWRRAVATFYASIAIALIGVAVAHYRGEGEQRQIVG